MNSMIRILESVECGTLNSLLEQIDNDIDTVLAFEKFTKSIEYDEDDLPPHVNYLPAWLFRRWARARGLSDRPEHFEVLSDLVRIGGQEVHDKNGTVFVTVDDIRIPVYISHPYLFTRAPECIQRFQSLTRQIAETAGCIGIYWRGSRQGVSRGEQPDEDMTSVTFMLLPPTEMIKAKWSEYDFSLIMS